MISKTDIHKCRTAEVCMKGRKIQIIIFSLVFLLFIGILPTQNAYTIDLLEDLLPPDEDCTTLFPQILIMKGFASTYNCEVSGPIELIVRNKPGTGEIEFSVLSSFTKAELVYDRHLNVKKSDTVLLSPIQKKIDVIGQDKRNYYRIFNGQKPDTIVLTLFNNGKEKKMKEFSCDRNVFPSDTVMLMLHTLLLKGIRKDFLFDIISLEDAIKVRMEMNYYFTDNVLSFSENFPFPQNISDAIRPDKKYHVFVMRVYGVLRLFAQSRWFFVYNTDYPYGFVAYWGGVGVSREIMYFPEIKYQ
jgi:hypothetical protein